MKIDGRLIAQGLKEKLKIKVSSLKKEGIFPHLAVIILGEDPSSLAYIRQKILTAEDIGVKISVINLPPDNVKRLKEKVQQLNNDKSVHGIIIQKPVPLDLPREELNQLVTPAKDVDGFHPQSPFLPPISLAILKILEYVYQIDAKNKENSHNFQNWLKKKKILIIGRGETGGKPIADTLFKNNIKFSVAHSKIIDLKALCLKSDVIISCVGKSKNILRQQNGVAKYVPVVRRDMVTNKTILIGVGMHTEVDNKIRTDYNLEDISEKTGYYTPVPGGVGPVNVACLFENLIKAVRS